MITLTLGTENYNEGQEILINSKEISSVVPSSRNQCYVSMKNGERIHIMESVSTVKTKIYNSDEDRPVARESGGRESSATLLTNGSKE